MAERIYRVYQGSSKQEGLQVTMIDFLTPFLDKYRKEYPKDNRRALRHVAWWLHREMKEDIKRGKAGNRSTPLLSEIDVPEIRKSVRKNTTPKTFAKHHPNSQYPMVARRHKGDAGRRLLQAIAYDNTTNPDSPVVGWTSKSAMAYGAALQGARRGTKWRFEHTGSQRITRKMQKKFAAMGFYGDPKSRKRKPKRYGQVGLKLNETIRQPKRPIIMPIYKSRSKFIAKRYVDRLNEYMRKRVAKITGRQYAIINNFKRAKVDVG